MGARLSGCKLMEKLSIMILLQGCQLLVAKPTLSFGDRRVRDNWIPLIYWQFCNLAAPARNKNHASNIHEALFSEWNFHPLLSLPGGTGRQKLVRPAIVCLVCIAAGKSEKTDKWPLIFVFLSKPRCDGVSGWVCMLLSPFIFHTGLDLPSWRHFITYSYLPPSGFGCACMLHCSISLWLLFKLRLQD